MTQQEKKRNNKIKGDLLKFESLVAIQSGKKRYWLENTNEKKKNDTVWRVVRETSVGSNRMGSCICFFFFLSFSLIIRLLCWLSVEARRVWVSSTQQLSLSTLALSAGFFKLLP